MKIERKPRQTNQQAIRDFNKQVLVDGLLQEFKDRQYFIKEPSRNMRRKNALRRAELAAKYQLY